MGVGNTGVGVHGNCHFFHAVSQMFSFILLGEQCKYLVSGNFNPPPPRLATLWFTHLSLGADKLGAKDECEVLLGVTT